MLIFFIYALLVTNDGWFLVVQSNLSTCPTFGVIEHWVIKYKT